MKIEENPLYGITKQGLLEILGATELALVSAINNNYIRYFIEDKKGKKREIIEPNKALKAYLQKLVEVLQQIPCPKYNKCGWKGQSALKNALAHIKQHAFVTTDVSNYYPNTKTKYVKEFFENVLNIKGEVLELLLKMTTFEGRIPIGAPTSTILAFLAHKKLFDRIDIEMTRRGIIFTLYADDVTLSAKLGITWAEIRYIQSVLNEHNLKLKNKKTKFYSFRRALVTGYYIDQNGRISVPHKIGHTIVKLLTTTPLNEMDIFELNRLLGYINYERQLNKRAFNVVRIRAIKRRKKLELEAMQRK